MAFGWIDFSEEDKRKALNAINSMNEPGSIDELGYGRIRDFFADQFFPGTSTIQTHAKYFIILRNILDDFSYTHIDSNEDLDSLIKRFLAKEYLCALYLNKKNINKDDGIIGSTELDTTITSLPYIDRTIFNNYQNGKYRKWIVRTPYMIYWNGLRQLGFLEKNAGSLRDALKNSKKNKKILDETPRRKSNNESEPGDSDDRDSIKSLIRPIVGFLKCKSCNNCNDKKCSNCLKWIPEIELTLTENDSKELKEKITMHLKDTLFEYLVNCGYKKTKSYLTNNNANEHNKYPHTFEMFSNKILNLPDLPVKYKTLLPAAVNFNKIITLTRIRYNMVMSLNKTGEVNLEYQAEWQYYLDYSQLLNTDDDYVDQIFSIIQNKRPNDDGDRKTKEFLKQFLHLLKNKAPDKEINDSIISRESEVKKDKRKAKLLTPLKYSDTWIGGRELDYRFGITNRLITEILNPGRLTW